MNEFLPGYGIDNELRAFLPTLAQLDLSDIQSARAVAAARMPRSPDYPEGVSVREVSVATGPKTPQLTVWLYTPTVPSQPRGALLYMPGGGFIIPAGAGSYAKCASLALNLDIVVALVEYRLAPEHRFPAGLSDGLAALEWIAEQGPVIGVDSARIGVGGDSAGAALAAGLALWVRDHGGPVLQFQYLGIPVLDDRLETWSMTHFVDTPLWNRPAAEMSWQYYRPQGIPTVRGVDAAPYLAPGRYGNLAGLPPAYVSVCEFDPLRDEGIDYAGRLMRAGVRTELHAYPGTFHGSHQLPSDVSMRMERDCAAAIGLGLAPR